MDVPDAIRNLRLCSAFKGHAVGVMGCVDSRNDTQLRVVDDNAACVSRFAGADETADCFFADNPAGRLIHLLAIDHKLLDGVPGGVADCAVLHEGQFCFVEFKLNAKGNSGKAVEDTYNKAVSQIENTLEIFDRNIRNAGIDMYAVTNVVCNVVVAEKFPRASATESNLIVKFADDHALDLSFDNRREF